MHDLKRLIVKFYKEHEKNIWLIILATIIIMLVLRTANTMSKKSQQEKYQRYYEQYSKANQNEIEDESDNRVKNTHEDPNDYRKEIVTFIELCNTGKMEQAYSMVSKTSKQYVVPTIQDFANRYFYPIFSQKRSYEIGNISTDRDSFPIFQVKYYPDFLSTGKKDEDSVITDYITGTIEDGEDKLKILNFISYEDMNQIYEDTTIKVKILSRTIGGDYEEYSIEVFNKTNNSIQLYEKQKEESEYENEEEYIIQQQNKANIIVSGRTAVGYVTDETDHQFIVSPLTTQKIQFRVQIYNHKENANMIRMENVIINGQKTNININI